MMYSEEPQQEFCGEGINNQWMKTMAIENRRKVS